MVLSSKNWFAQKEQKGVAHEEYVIYNTGADGQSNRGYH